MARKKVFFVESASKLRAPKNQFQAPCLLFGPRATRNEDLLPELEVAMNDKKIWRRTDPASGTQYVISPRRDWIDETFVRESFAGKEMYWAIPVSKEATTMMLDNSITLCLYIHDATAPDPSTLEPSKSALQQIGMARLVTDHVTFAFLTDVFITPEHQGSGLGNWLVECLKTTVDDARGLGAFRRLALLTGRGGRVVDFYKRTLEMEAGEDIPDLVFLTTQRRLS